MILFKEMVQNSQLLPAYLALLRLLPSRRRDRVLWQIEPVYKILGIAIVRLLERIITDGGRTPGVPHPLDFIRNLDDLGMSVKNYYVALLGSMLARKPPVEEMVAAFESAAASQIAAASTPAEMRHEDVEALFDEMKILYVVYLYLHDLQASSPLLTAMDPFVHRCELPTDSQLRGALRGIQWFAHAELLRLRELGKTLKLRHLLRNPVRLRVLTERFSKNNDLDGLQRTYASARELGTLTENCYQVFITAFLSFWRSQQMALSVWEDMVRDGINPSVSSWNALLRYGRTHDRSALLLLWQKMIQVGVVPDVHCWTTRIHSQLAWDQVDEGFESLAQMEAAGITPSTVTINAAVDGLLTFNRFEEAQRVIQFAESKGVAADLVTYNTLMRGIMKRGGGSVEVKHMLEVMRSRGLSPDVYTFTTALDGLYQPQRNDPDAMLSAPPTEAEVVATTELDAA